jgi:hypothetical protein
VILLLLWAVRLPVTVGLAQLRAQARESRHAQQLLAELAAG